MITCSSPPESIIKPRMSPPVSCTRRSAEVHTDKAHTPSSSLVCFSRPRPRTPSQPSAHWRSHSVLIGKPDSCDPSFCECRKVFLRKRPSGFRCPRSTTAARVNAVVLADFATALSTASQRFSLPVRLLTLSARLPEMTNLAMDATRLVAHRSR